MRQTLTAGWRLQLAWQIPLRDQQVVPFMPGYRLRLLCLLLESWGSLQAGQDSRDRPHDPGAPQIPVVSQIWAAFGSQLPPPPAESPTAWACRLILSISKARR